MNYIKILLLAMTAITCNSQAMAKQRNVSIKVVETTDVHGMFFPYDFINRKPKTGSLARVSTYVNEQRKTYGNNLILLENGDILQGQPTCYYYNYIATQERNVVSDITNYLKYDAAAFGNHDVETGHAVYDKWIGELHCPVLGANIINTKTGDTYVKPYITMEREGIKIAVLGLLTPAIPQWLSEDIWSGMRFEEMVSSARKWVKMIQEKEKPDVLIGLFHSGREGGIVTPEYDESASLKVAKEVEGFDVVFFGHDHQPYSQTVTNNAGKPVVMLNAGYGAANVAEAEVTLTVDGKKKVSVLNKQTKGQLVDVRNLPVDQQYMKAFEQQTKAVETYVSKQIGTIENTIYTREAFFGSSAFNDLILNLQQQITHADVALNAPLMFNAAIEKGPIRVSDLFNLYKYENKLYVMKLTGKEIKNLLEMSYGLWVNTMTTPEDHLFLLKKTMLRGDQEREGFQNPFFNFDSASGIDYEVDVTKPNGEKVNILRMTGGQPFDEEKWYTVAVNSYRGNGGGELLTRGAGIPKDSLDSRIIWRSEKDQRYYLMQEIERMGTINPKPNNNWRFVPEEWVKPAAERDYKLLFNEELRINN